MGIDFSDSISLKISDHSLPLGEAICIDNEWPVIDRAAVLEIVDLPKPTDRYQPSTARREARKQNIQDMYQSWQQKYQKLKRKHRDKNDTWYAEQIAKLDIAKGRSAETIRKNIKP